MAEKIKIDEDTVNIRIENPKAKSDIQIEADNIRDRFSYIKGMNSPAKDSLSVVITGFTEADSDGVSKQLVLRGSTTDRKELKIDEIKFNHEEYKLSKPLSVNTAGGEINNESIKQLGELISNKEVQSGISIGGYQIPFTGDLIKMEKVGSGHEASLSSPNEKSSMNTAMAQASEVNLPNIVQISDTDKPLASIPKSGGSKGIGIA